MVYGREHLTVHDTADCCRMTVSSAECELRSDDVLTDAIRKIHLRSCITHNPTKSDLLEVVVSYRVSDSGVVSREWESTTWRIHFFGKVFVKTSLLQRVFFPK